ncbi:MAG: CobB/CobQ domain protein glutamine amidotransferase [Acidimicrobiales bacterium]|jgi:CobQ-like glutamine amidotransferase family enzyme|nr:CobB/CobQ domain protein glutamine amidotransferase [Acidimicrobiales bacterium]
MADSAVSIVLVRPALLGTYGDGGNALVLAVRLGRRGIQADVVLLDGNQPLPRASDLIVLGGGEDGAQEAVADDDVLRHSLTLAVAAGAAVLAICGGFQLLGDRFQVGAGRSIAGFGLLDCTTDRLSERAVGEVVADSALPGLEVPLTGFENHAGRTLLGAEATPLGLVSHGVGNGDGGGEGAVQGRVIGSYLHGPVLARNPALADSLLAHVVGPLPPLAEGPVTRLRSERLAAARGRRVRRH